ncbi:MAG: hypothetical protein QXE31_04665 [Candidatus Woesearchaeota archaeon]
MPIKKVPISEVRKKYTKLPIDRKWLILGLIIYIFTFFLKIPIMPLIYLSIFCVSNALLLTIDRYVSLPIDVEFSTFTASLMTIAYGFKWGLFTAILTKFAAIVYNRNFRVDHIFMIIGYVISAIISNFLKALPIVLIGIIATIVVNIYTIFVSKYITMLTDYEIMTYGLSNTIFNFILFIAFSEPLLSIMI